MDERFAFTPAEENQKGLNAETGVFLVCVWIMLLAVAVLKTLKPSCLVTRSVRFHQFSPVSSTGWDDMWPVQSVVLRRA